MFVYENILQRDIKDILLRSISLRHHCDFRIYVTGLGIMRGLSWTGHQRFGIQTMLLNLINVLHSVLHSTFNKSKGYKFTGKLTSRSLFNITLFHASLINFQNIKQLHFMTFEGLVVKYDWRVGGLTFI